MTLCGTAIASVACIAVAFIPTDKGKGTIYYDVSVFMEFPIMESNFVNRLTSYLRMRFVEIGI